MSLVAQLIMREAVCDPNSQFHKNNSRRVRAQKRAQKLVRSWDYERCWNWLRKNERSNYKIYDRFYLVIEARMAELEENDSFAGLEFHF